MHPLLYTVFLYGANIPNGRWVSRQEVESALQSLRPGIKFAGIVGDADNIVLASRTVQDEHSLRIAVERALDFPCAVISAPTLRSIVATAMDRIRALDYPNTPPYRASIDGVEWELCLVMSSDTFPCALPDEELLFSPRRNVVPLGLLLKRALLVRRRRTTDRGTRVMLGSTLIDPWKRILRQRGISVGCLTSRTLGRVIAAALETFTCE